MNLEGSAYVVHSHSCFLQKLTSKAALENKCFIPIFQIGKLRQISEGSQKVLHSSSNTDHALFKVDMSLLFFLCAQNCLVHISVLECFCMAYMSTAEQQACMNLS